jgi:hypothetical protein
MIRGGPIKLPRLIKRSPAIAIAPLVITNAKRNISIGLSTACPLLNLDTQFLKAFHLDHRRDKGKHVHSHQASPSH